jgi:hypothetical protein
LRAPNPSSRARFLLAVFSILSRRSLRVSLSSELLSTFFNKLFVNITLYELTHPTELLLIPAQFRGMR